MIRLWEEVVLILAVLFLVIVSPNTHNNIKFGCNFVPISFSKYSLKLAHLVFTFAEGFRVSVMCVKAPPMEDSLVRLVKGQKSYPQVKVSL